MHDHPTDPRGASSWPVWFAFAGLAAAFLMTAVGTAVLGGVYSLGGGDLSDRSPALTAAFTVLQNALLVLTAVGFAALVARPTARDFGFVPMPLRRVGAWVLVAGVVFYAVSGLYSALVDRQGQQDVVEALGAERGLGYLVTAGLIVIVLAPVTEELFFRGFMFRSLRNRLPFAAAAAVVGAIFGAIHYSGPETLPLIPLLALLGVLFCFLYERTGSLYPAIALHAINNSVALGVTVKADGAEAVAATLGLVALGGCAFVARRQRKEPSAPAAV